MLNRGIVIVLLTLMATNSSSLSESEDAESQVLQVIDEMNTAWLEHDLSRCVSYFSSDTDFENSFGWLIYGRESLERFLREYLFAKYPIMDKKYVQTSHTVEFLTPKLALVEEAKKIYPQDKQDKPRFVRTTFLLRLNKSKWLIWKTRSWTPRFNNSPPIDFVIPNRFPDIFDAQ